MARRQMRLISIASILGTLIIPYSLLVYRFSNVENSIEFIDHQLMKIDARLLNENLERDVEKLKLDVVVLSKEKQEDRVQLIRSLHHIDKRVYLLESEFTLYSHRQKNYFEDIERTKLNQDFVE